MARSDFYFGMWICVMPRGVVAPDGSRFTPAEANGDAPLRRATLSMAFSVINARSVPVETGATVTPTGKSVGLCARVAVPVAAMLTTVP